MKQSLGLIEFTSIAKGIEATDIMVKAGNVELLLAKTICPGKFISIVDGDVDAVRSSVDAGLNNGESFIADHLIIPNLHKDIIPAISGSTNLDSLAAIGVVESYTVASLISGADIAAKSSMVKLIEIRLGVGIGGKSFFTITGRVSDVMDSVEKSSSYIKQNGYLVYKTVIPSPHKSLYSFIV